jgi:phosphoglycolate phosphatase-like HAD superfamily hydrolase
LSTDGSGPRVRHVVWDWNGTLLDDAELTIEATSASMVAAGHAPVPGRIYRTQFVRPLQLFYERLLERPVSEEEAATLDGAFHFHYLQLVGRAVLRPDAIDALDAVASEGLGQSLLSMWPHEHLVPLVERLGLDHYFSQVDGNRALGRLGKTDSLVAHLDVLGLDANGVLMIGDSTDDAKSAADVGCRCVLIDSGHATPDALGATGVPVVGDLIAALRTSGIAARDGDL